MRNVIASTKCAAISLILGICLTACEDSSSASAGQNDDPGVESSSSLELGSSSSEKLKSSSSDTQGDAKQSSSSEKSGKSSSSVIESSSSSEKLWSSSSVETPKSSSSELSESSSSSADEEKSSSSSDILSSSGESTPSSSTVTLATPCMEWIVDNCEYVTLLDDRDGQTYKTVKIGNQWWMAENLNYATAKGSYCYEEYDNNCVASGRLYEWAYAMGKSEDECGYGHECDLGVGNVQGVCPDGWHVPSKSEWETLIAAVGGEDIAGRKLKAKAFGVAQLDVINENAFGFWAYSAGERSDSGYFGSDGYIANFWSSTENGSADAYFVVLSCCSDFAELSYNGFKSYGYSVRCVKD